LTGCERMEVAQAIEIREVRDAKDRIAAHGRRAAG
jgi:hypothetical protein